MPGLSSMVISALPPAISLAKSYCGKMVVTMRNRFVAAGVSCVRELHAVRQEMASTVMARNENRRFIDRISYVVGMRRCGMLR